MNDPLKQDARDIEALDRLLAEVAARHPAPSEDFLARLVADAEAEAGAAQLCPPAKALRPGPRAWLAALGGWPALGGLAAAALAGVWIGIAPPASLDSYLTGSVSVDLMPEGLALLEGAEP